MGPRSRDLLAGLTAPTWARRASRSPPAVQIDVAGSDAARDPDDVRRRARLGADGARSPTPPAVHDALDRPAVALANAGYYAIESLRLEKGYRAFGRELTPDCTPVEAGLVFATALEGRQGLPRPGGAGGAPRAAGRGRSAPAGGVFVVDDPEPMLWGGELVLRDGAPAGQVTSAAWGETVGASVGLALLRSDDPVTRPTSSAEDSRSMSQEIDMT